MSDIIPQGVLPITPFQIDPDAAELLSEISLTASPEEQAAAAQAAADYIPKAKRLPNVGQTSREELEFRYAQVAKWISLSKKKGEIKKLAYQEWGIKPRTFENYYTAAYKILAAEADTTPDEQFQKSVRFYELVIADDSAEFKDKIAARKALDELLGIQKPRKTAQVGANGQVVDPVTGGDVVNLTVVMNRLVTAGMSDDQLKALAAAGEVYEAVEKGVKNGIGNTPAAGH